MNKYATVLNNYNKMSRNIITFLHIKIPFSLSQFLGFSELVSIIISATAPGRCFLSDSDISHTQALYLWYYLFSTWSGIAFSFINYPFWESMSLRAFGFSLPDFMQLPLHNCTPPVTVGKWLKLSIPQFTYLQNRDNTSTYFHDYYED